MSFKEFRNKLITDLNRGDFFLDLSSKEDARRYGLSLNKLNFMVERFVSESENVASYIDEEDGDISTIYCFKGIYFIFSGGGMSSEFIESCTDKKKDELIKKGKKLN